MKKILSLVMFICALAVIASAQSPTPTPSASPSPTPLITLTPQTAPVPPVLYSSGTLTGAAAVTALSSVASLVGMPPGVPIASVYGKTASVTILSGSMVIIRIPYANPAYVTSGTGH